MLKITEIFSSFQGEGELSGEPSVFIRFSGCNLRCWFCDTPYSSWKPEGEMMEICEIINEVQQHEPEKVVITGGEPMLQPEVVPLSIKLKELGYHVTIETAGTVDRPVAADLMSISPKLENSTPQNANGWKDKHEALRHKPESSSDSLKDTIIN